MPHLFTVPAGAPIADLTATHVLSRHIPAELANAIIFVPNRRSAIAMRYAFQRALHGKAALLPRILPLAELSNELLTLLGKDAFAILEKIPPTMSSAQQRYLLTKEVLEFERKRISKVTLHYALTLADELMKLQETCARAGVSITHEKLRPLVHADFATHWNQALLFLGILTERWPEIETQEGLTTTACREVKLLHALADHWAASPATFPVYAVGSTASQPATAALLRTIADMPNGQVILPGVGVSMDEPSWQTIEPGHPLFHIKSFLDLWPVSPAQLQSLAEPIPSIWLEALAPASTIPSWPSRPLPKHQNVRLIPCAHGEEEARVITLLLRETLEKPDQHVAVITPDEGLMARVAAHMKRYGIQIDRLNAGTLANTQTGSLWTALVTVMREPDKQLAMRSLLHHPLLAIDISLLNGLEKGWHGINRSRTGQLPHHDQALKQHPIFDALSAFVQDITRETRSRTNASKWVSTCRELLAPWIKVSGEGHDAVMEQLDELMHADSFGPINIEDFAALLEERLDTPWRDAGLNTHPRIHMLTPVEARMQHFDRVILANMQEQLWPGMRRVNPWLNLAAEQALGLPVEQEHISLMAHDVLMMASGGEVFLTYPLRDGGSPTTRSRFIERLLTLLASHGIKENAITSRHYNDWADMQDASNDYTPETPIFALPSTEQRPRRLPVSQIDKLFTDPFSIYAQLMLGLKELKAIDANPEASDFGSLTHKAIEVLTRHWNEHAKAATPNELEAMAEHALRSISDRPNIDLFWRSRLLGGLRYVNNLEMERRNLLQTVLAEENVEAEFKLASGESITLHGRIDRQEIKATGITIIDHKTGEIPKLKQILDGRALQLLAYAMVLQSTGQTVEGVEYWQLPRLGDTGQTLQAPLVAEIEDKLLKELEKMLEPSTPFLARPINNNADERFGTPYDGISRYDEWAG